MDTSRIGLVVRRCGAVAASVAVGVLGTGGRASAQVMPGQTVATAAVPGSVRTPINVTSVSGVGATASEAQAGGNAAGAGAVLDPGAAGVPYNDMVMIGPQGGTVQALSPALTRAVGRALLVGYPNAGGNQGAEAAAQSLNYTVNVVNNKVASARGAPGGQFVFPPAISNATSGMTMTSSRANETATVDPGNAAAVDAFGLAQASLRMTGGNAAGFSVGIVKDPITFQLTNPTMAGSVSIDLGGPQGSFLLSASGPGAFAGALVEFGINGNALASFDILVNPGMTKKSDVEVDVFTLDPSLGYASNGAFANAILANLSFNNDGTTATLSGADVPLDTITLAPNSGPVTVSLDIGAVTAVPEPSSVALLLAGAAALAGLAHRYAGVPRRRP